MGAVLIGLMITAQLTLTCAQVRALYHELGPDEFQRRAVALGLTEAQMKQALACIGGRR